MQPPLSAHFQSRKPSAIRLTQIEFMKRTDGVQAINTAIGNVSLPMHPAMQERMFHLKDPKSPFHKGVVKYSTTVGEPETTDTFLHLIAASGFSTKGLFAQVTDGGSQAMELALLGVSGPAGTTTKPLLLLDPAYSNYASMAERIGRSTVTVTRHLEATGKFSLPPFSEIEKVIERTKPGALLVIPYDNPTGQFLSQNTLNQLGRICVKHNLWMLSDEAYREVFYTEEKASSVWGITEQDAPGITGRRISIESASKIWNACGLRIGALVTDHKSFHEQAVAENTANLCANAIGQYIFGALLHESKQSLQNWFDRQKTYYGQMAKELTHNLKMEIPNLIVSSPDAALYTVVDLCNILPNAMDFVLFAARKGTVNLNGTPTTLLVAPMEGFYSTNPNPGKTQVRIAYVQPAETMRHIPHLFKELLKQYEKDKN